MLVMETLSRQKMKISPSEKFSLDEEDECITRSTTDTDTSSQQRSDVEIFGSLHSLTCLSSPWYHLLVLVQHSLQPPQLKGIRRRGAGAGV